MGNCPSFSPRDDRIMFLSNADAAQNGVWLMQADGTDRRLLGNYGRPRWSPFGRQTMIITYQSPRQVTLMDVDPGKGGLVDVPDYKFFTEPSWAGERTIVAAIGTADDADTVAFIDVDHPRPAKIKEVLWRRANGPDVVPSYPIYSAITGRCIFVGTQAKRWSIYSIQPGKALPVKPLGPPGSNPGLAGLVYSPDGRYVLYSVYGLDQRQGNPERRTP